jgi:superfamily II DNA or RNA helicase
MESFKKYIIKKPKYKETMENFCISDKGKYTLQPQQKALADILSSNLAPWKINEDNIRGILLYHQIGAGKTCTAISIAEEFKLKKNIMVVLPAALIGNFLSELRTECTGDKYVSKIERNKLKNLNFKDEEYKIIINKINKRIYKYYTIYSYHKFINLIKADKLKKLNNTLLFIDEVQNMISMNGTFYKLLMNIINNSDNKLKIVLMTATPMFDRPVEIALTLNLIKKNDLFNINRFNQDYLNSKYKFINIDIFSKKIKNLISYYRGAPPIAYPKCIFKKIKCNMSDFQYKSYLTSLCSDNNYIRGSFKNVDILNLPENFLLGPRLLSNIAFPNKSVGQNGFSSLKGENLQMQNISNYSIKFFKIINKINKCEGPVFVYSNFKEEGGIKSFIKFIEYHGWKNYITYGIGLKRFCIWSGDETQKIKEEIKFVYNNKTNENGNNIKLILGTPSIKEGISLLRVQQVHILEPYWNMSRIMQIMGRAVRFCSHKDVPKYNRIVNVYLYLATYKQEETIDKHIWKIAKKKNILIQQFEQVLKENAFDCELFLNRNSYKTDENKLICKNNI